MNPHATKRDASVCTALTLGSISLAASLKLYSWSAWSRLIPS